MNEIIEVLQQYVEAGRHIRSVSPNNHIIPTGIVVIFDDGTEAQHALNYTGDRTVFNPDWRSARTWMNLQWERLAQQEIQWEDPETENGEE